MKLITVSMLVLSSLVLTGCFEFRTYVESYKPIIPMPDQEDLVPLVPDSEIFNADGSIADQEALLQSYISTQDNLVILINENESLRAVVAAYNEWAEQQNVQTGYTLPQPIQPTN